MNPKEELRYYRNHLANVLLPFWDRAYDPENSGIFTCFNNAGTEMVSTDKYVWSQGRMAWAYSRLAEDIRRGILPELDGREAEYLEKAEKTCDFIRDHAVLPDSEGVCAYLLTRDGIKKETSPGSGYYTSFFVDCFVILGFAEYAAASGRKDYLDLAVSLYRRSVARVEAGFVRTDPYPIPEGFESQAVHMILTVTADCIARAAKILRSPVQDAFDRETIRHTERILYHFRRPGTGFLQELKPVDSAREDSFSARHTMPGHALESMWFCLHAYRDRGLPVPEQIFEISEASLKAGWDEPYGGMLRCIDCEGGEPKGVITPGDRYELLMADTWDSKLWWVHSETLYMSMLCYVSTGKPVFLEYYEKTKQYIEEHFINPDSEVGEWIQILDRSGKPMEKLVALPVKDPFHIIRNVLMLIELLSR